MRCVFLALLFLHVAGPGHAADFGRPNILFLLADDLGWGDLGCHGNKSFKTPNIDRLAREGTDFHQFNVANPVCSPSRTAFTTGKFPARFSIHQAIGALDKNAEDRQVDWLDPRAVKRAVRYGRAHALERPPPRGEGTRPA